MEKNEQLNIERQKKELLKTFGFEPIWFEITMTNIELELDENNSNIKEVSEEKCYDTYLKLFYWKDHKRVTDVNVNEVKKFFQSKFNLEILPQIRVCNCQEVGYPVNFQLENNGKILYQLFMTYDGFIHRADVCDQPNLNISPENNDLYCLRYNENFKTFKYWKHVNGNTELDESSESLKYDVPSRMSSNNDNKLLLLHFICSNSVPEKLIEFWNDDLYVHWKVIKEKNTVGCAQRKSLKMSEFIKNFYKKQYYSDKYVNKCLEKFKTNIDLNSTIEEFISSDVGKECKQKVPNKVVEHIYKIDLTQFLI